MSLCESFSLCSDTVDIIFAKFAWTVIDIKFLQSTFKTRKSPSIFQGPSHRNDSSSNELVLDFCGR